MKFSTWPFNESHWAVLSCGVVYIMLYRVVLTFESVDKVVKCDHIQMKAIQSSISLCCCLLCSTR